MRIKYNDELFDLLIYRKIKIDKCWSNAFDYLMVDLHNVGDDKQLILNFEFLRSINENVQNVRTY